MAKEKNALSQISNLSNNLTTIQKVAIAGTFLAVVVLLVVFISSATSTKMQTMYSNLEEVDAAKVVEYLVANDIDYELTAGGRTIKVDAAKVNEARLALAAEGIPGESNVGYEIFDETNLGMSEFVQKVNYRRALEGELSRTINSFDEVKKSRVHIVIPEQALFKEDQKPPTASITLHLGKHSGMSRSSIAGIQNLVASSIEGMKSGNVKITDQSGRLLTEEMSDMNTTAGITEAQHNQKKTLENYLESKVQSLLQGAVGNGNAQVRVNAELDFTQIEQTKTQFDPESQVARSEQIINEESKSADSLSFPYVNMSSDEANSITNYEISKNIEHIIKEVGAIKKLSVAAMINGETELITNNGEKSVQYTPRNEEEMKKFEELVKNAIGYDPSRNDQVSVINVPFEHTTNLDNYDIPAPVQWYENPDIRKIILIIIGLLIVAILVFSLLRSSFVNEKMRVAMSLPESSSSESLGLLEELDIEDDDSMFLPSDIPDQMLLDGEKQASLEGRNIRLELEEAMAVGKDSAGTQLQSDGGTDIMENYESLSEERMMKLEIKKKVEHFLKNNTEDAVKLLRNLATSGKGNSRLGEGE